MAGAGSVVDPWHFGSWIRIRGSVQMTNKVFFKVLCLLLFEGTFTTVFIDKKSKRSHKKYLSIKGFLTFIVCWWKDPDPGGPKTYGSGSTTLGKGIRFSTKALAINTDFNGTLNSHRELNIMHFRAHAFYSTSFWPWPKLCPLDGKRSLPGCLRCGKVLLILLPPGVGAPLLLRRLLVRNVIALARPVLVSPLKGRFRRAPGQRSFSWDPFSCGRSGEV